MRKIFKVAMTLLKGGGTFVTQKKRSAVRWILPVVLGVSVIAFGASMVFLTFEAYDTMSVLSMADAIVPLAFGATSVVVFIFGIFYVVSTMYHADDIELLMALPLRPYHILGAKFVTLVVYEYIMEAFILVPILIGFGIKSGAGVMYVVYSAALFLMTPIIALAMASVIVMIVMRFTSFGKNKQMFKFVGGIIAMALAIGFNVAIQSSASSISGEQLAAIMSGESSIVSVVSNIFPGIVFAANALIFSSTLIGLGNFALFLLCCAAAVVVFIGVGQIVYFKGVAGVSETSAKRKALSGEALGKATAGASATVSYIKKELRMLVRSPIGFMNCVLVNLIWPIVLIAMVIGQGSSLDDIGAFIRTIDQGLVAALIVGMSAFVASSNAVTSTSVSREGKSLYVSKYIPMAMEKQLRAKIGVGMIISSMGIVLLVVAAIVLGMHVDTALVALVIGFIAMAAVAVAGILIDASRPKLNWLNEQQAIKQNLNVLLHMLVGIAVAAALILPVYLAHMSLPIAAIYMVGVLLVLLAVLMRAVKTHAAQKLLRMDT